MKEEGVKDNVQVVIYFLKDCCTDSLDAQKEFISLSFQNITDMLKRGWI